MAMPSELPPPFDDEPQPPGWTDAEIFALPSPVARLVEDAAPKRLADYVLELAQQMAESVGDQLGDVLRRTKSRNWMLGTLRRRTSGRHSDDEIRDAIAALARQHRPTISEELGARHVELTSRRPLIFLEASAWPVWAPRVDKLGALVAFPMTILELTHRAKSRLGWTDNYVKQTTAAAEAANELWWDRAFNHWHRTDRRILLANPKQKTKTERTHRHLPVALNEADRGDLSRRLQAIDVERDALEAELSEHKRRIAAALKGRDEARERVLEAWKTGRETQSVECEDRWDYAAKQVTTVRKDTGEVVESRAMTVDELQVPIPEATATS